MTELQADAEGLPEYPALGAFNYPWWVILLGLAVVGAFGYSLLSLPSNIVLARELHEAKQLDEAGNYAAAEKDYAAVLAGMPRSRAAQIGMAHALFADGDAANDPQALALIGDMKLDKDDWRTLSAVMPEAYREQFSATEEH